VILTTLDGTFLVIFLMALINIDQAAKERVELNSSFIWSIWALTAYLTELIAVPTFLFCHYKNLDKSKRLKRRCGYMFQDQNYRIRGPFALAYPILCQLRFVLLAFLVVFLKKYLIVQCICVNLSSIGLMAVLGLYRPFSEQSQNYKSMVDEFVIVIVMDLLLISSDPVLDVDMRFEIGWAIIAILVAIIFIS
jgi:hypothetical protein